MAEGRTNVKGEQSCAINCCRCGVVVVVGVGWVQSLVIFESESESEREEKETFREFRSRLRTSTAPRAAASSPPLKSQLQFSQRASSMADGTKISLETVLRTRGQWPPRPAPPARSRKMGSTKTEARFELDGFYQISGQEHSSRHVHQIA